MSIDDVFDVNGGLATREQLLAVISPKSLAAHVTAGALVRVWHGVYAREEPGIVGLLAGLDLMTGKQAVACMSTAAKLYGFDTENDARIHVLDPGIRMRPNAGLMVHQRTGAPLRRIAGRLATSPAWTAIETARALRRPRALATLDAALRCGACSVAEMENAVREQRGRRGIVKLRHLLPYADGRSESPMESEARLVFIDGGIPPTHIQYEIRDHHGDLWRVDFAWPEARVAAEYDSMEWHANPATWKRDHLKTNRLRECGWDLVRFVVDDVRQYPADLTDRVRSSVEAARLAG